MGIRRRGNLANDLHEALSLGLVRSQDASLRAQSAGWLLNGKAIAHQSLAEQHILARDAKDPGAKKIVEDLQQARGRLAAQINRSPTPGLEKEYQKEMQDLKTSEQDLAQKLARAVGRPYRSNPWVTLDELRAKLGAKTAFVDIARFPVREAESDDAAGVAALDHERSTLTDVSPDLRCTTLYLRPLFFS